MQDGLLESVIGLKDGGGVAGKMHCVHRSQKGPISVTTGRQPLTAGSRRRVSTHNAKLTAVEALVMLFIVPLLFS